MSSSLEKQPISSSNKEETSCYLNESSIESLFLELDKDHLGIVSKTVIIDTLSKVYRQLAPTPKTYHLIHASRTADWHVFVDSLFPDSNRVDAEYTLEQFKMLVRGWKLPPVLAPAAAQSIHGDDDDDALSPNRRANSLSRFLQRMRNRCSTNLHRYIFVLIVLCLQISLALWQFFLLYNSGLPRAAFGTGMLIAKAASGALYPTLTLLVFSMSKWTQYFLRQSRYLRRFIDWEYAQHFHIMMACLAFLLGTIHAIAHLTGSYRHALHHPEALAQQIFTKPGIAVPTNYADFMKWRASWTGLLILAFFTIMTIGGLPAIRKRSFELFQWSHLLMYPLFGMLLVHGSSGIIKPPILGWWLLLPILFVVTEKLYRMIRFFIPMEAAVLFAEDNMVALSIKIGRRIARHRPGQYIFLQVPTISRLQWHPFTVSKITEDSILIHIRTSAGNWTSALWKEAIKSDKLTVHIEGPYGSPSREFYRYDNTIIFGAGIGITPFSAILFDLLDKLSENSSPWAKDGKQVKQYLKRQDQQWNKEMRSRPTGAIGSTSSYSFLEGKRGSVTSDTATATATKPSTTLQAQQQQKQDRHLSHLQAILRKRSISLHWTVKSSQDLQWFSLLLNQLSGDFSVKINIHLYVTQSEQDQAMSTLVFRSLLDHHRVDSLQTTSALTGLYQTCHFARPNLVGILKDYHKAYTIMNSQDRPSKVGVIYCGPYAIGRVLSRKCQFLTGQSRQEGRTLRYFYHSESF